MAKGPQRHSWDYPDCPNCGTSMFVDSYRGHDADYECYQCSQRFDAPQGATA